MNDPTDRILEVAQRAGRAAARLCQAVLAEAPASPDAMAKLGEGPVTVADYGSQALILKAVAEAFPDHAVIAEEGSAHLREHTGDASTEQIIRLVSRELGQKVDFDQICAWIDHKGAAEAEFTWAIDPIDGTKGFLRREQYAVAIGILRHGQPHAGVLACPSLDGGMQFSAARGRGTTAVPLAKGPPQRVHVTSFSDPAKVRVLGSVEAAHGDPKVVKAVIDDLKLTGGMVRIDSMVKYAVVARGEAEVYLRPRNKPDYRENIWDHAAGVIVTEEAGGRVSDLDGRPLDFSRGKRLEDNRGVLATNGVVHAAILESLRRVEALRA
ncbi:MAG: 3'(2'),5'-bisphosphate nucleotidase [Planctomycetota bacterium]|nr:MAG: 3'(2'),5'-bisphosphate nucleotidase [Planctomycetota bacterium]